MILRLLLLVAIGTGLSSKSQADSDVSVVDVRRNITLSDDDPVYKDFYLNAGPGSGLKKNLVVTAVRKLNIRDASGANAIGEIMVPVGQLKIIAVYDRIAVAREFTLLSRDELPMLEQVGIMSGDRIDLQGAFIDNSKPKKRKVAIQEAMAPTIPPVETAKAEVVNKVSSVAPAETLEKTADSGNNSGNE